MYSSKKNEGENYLSRAKVIKRIKKVTGRTCMDINRALREVNDNEVQAIAYLNKHPAEMVCLHDAGVRLLD